jgi:hypothetical protein
LPDALNGVELRAIRGQEQEENIAGEAEGLGLMKGAVVEDEEVAGGGKLGGQVIEEELETRGIEVGKFEKATRPGGGLDRAIQVIVLKDLLDAAERFDPPQREAPPSDG